MQPDLEALSLRLREVNDHYAIAALLSWDQATGMPPGGGEARARHMATMRRLGHERFASADTGRMIDAAEAAVGDAPYDSDEAALVRLARRDYDRAVRLPAEFVAEISEHGAASYQAWTKARPDNDFATMQPHLERSLDLAQRYAGFYPDFDHPMDALIDRSDYGMTVAQISELFGRLREALVALLGEIQAAEQVSTEILSRRYDAADQLAYGERIVRDLGYDFDRGRLDLTPHPFMTKFSLGDVRITTRVNEHDLGDALFSMMHEAGHAMYEQGIDRSYEATPLARGTSSGVHESQSRLWENIVGRSAGFWSHYFPSLQAQFPAALADADEEDFVRAINSVQPSLIRTEADEVTYNLHVMIRFDLEHELHDGRLSIADLPAAWRARYESDLGVTPPDDRDGVLQDVHWFGGLPGGSFQGYALGNIMSAQFYDAAVAAEPEVPADIAAGSFDRLRGWLTDNVYRHGRKFTADELLERATGRALVIEPYVDYLRTKYRAIYQLNGR